MLKEKKMIYKNNIKCLKNSSSLSFGWKNFLVNLKKEVDTTLGGFFDFDFLYSFTIESFSLSISDDKKLDLFDTREEDIVHISC
jgi:hypothetical protein